MVDNLHSVYWFFSNSLEHSSVFFSFGTVKMYFLYCVLTVSPAFRSKANLWKVNLLICTEGFGSLWTQRVRPICISTSVSHDLVYPVKADLLSVVLFQEVFWHSCVCVSARWRVRAHQISPPSYLASVAQQAVDVLEVLRVSEDQQQNQIKCHLDSSEWRDCLTAQGNGFALHLLFWLRILFLPLNTNLPCLRG